MRLARLLPIILADVLLAALAGFGPSAAVASQTWQASQPALVEPDDDIPGVPSPTVLPIMGTLDAYTDAHDVYAINLIAGQTLDASITGFDVYDFDLYLFRPGSTSVALTDDIVAKAEATTYPDGFTFVVPETGTYYLDAWASPDASLTTGNYTLSYAAYLPATRVSLYAPSTSPYRSVNVYGYLKSAGGSNLAEGTPVEIWAKSTGGWEYAATAHTTAKGKYSRTMAPKTKTYYRAVYRGDASHLGVTSASDSVLPKVRLTRTTSWSTLCRYKAYYAKGYIEPHHSTGNSNKVKIRAYKKGSDGDYHYVKSFTGSYVYYSRSKTAYKAKVVLTSKGPWKLVAYHATDSTNYRTSGSADYVTVK